MRKYVRKKNIMTRSWSWIVHLGHLCRGNASEQKVFSSRDPKAIEKREEVRIVRGVARSMELVQSAGTGEQNAGSSAIQGLTIRLNY
jgi:hypothetical protein